MHCVQKRLAFLRARPSESNFDEVRVTEKRVQCNVKNSLFYIHSRVAAASTKSQVVSSVYFFCKKKVTEFASCGVAVSELKTAFCCVLRVGFAHISSPYAAE